MEPATPGSDRARDLDPEDAGWEGSPNDESWVDDERPGARSAAKGGDSDSATNAAGQESRVDWTSLPNAVRAQLAEIASSAVVAMRRADLPQSVRPVARFAPAKRAQLGRSVLVGALAEPVFRSAVLEWCREHRAGALDVGAEDVAAAAAGALLTDSPVAGHLVELAARRADDSRLRSERDSATARCRRLNEDNERLRSERDAARAKVPCSGGTGSEEADKLRKRLREQGVRLRAAKDAEQAAQAELDRVRAEADSEVREITAERDRERERATEARNRARHATDEVEQARRSAQEARQADEVRLNLLMDTLSGAVHGLRQEFPVSGAGPRPADTVQGAGSRSGGARAVTEVSTLDRLLALPSVHLVVDGYNVTKTGYPELPLSEQRDRLTRQLATLAARTGAEVTLVFDGAGVVGAPRATPRGVRVLFSDPGVQADDVIRSLVQAEPQGRPLVVATSDRAVVESVEASGAHSVPSTIVLARLSRS